MQVRHHLMQSSPIVHEPVDSGQHKAVHGLLAFSGQCGITESNVIHMQI